MPELTPEPQLDHRIITQYGASLFGVFVPLDLLHEINDAVAPRRYDFLNEAQTEALLAANLIQVRLDSGIMRSDGLRSFVNSLEAQRLEHESQARLFGSSHLDQKRPRQK